jgi:hypothetical protein
LLDLEDRKRFTELVVCVSLTSHTIVL